MKAVNVPCVVGETIYYPYTNMGLVKRLRVIEVRLTQHEVIVEAINDQSGLKYCFPESAFGKKVFAGKDGKVLAFEVARGHY